VYNLREGTGKKKEKKCPAVGLLTGGQKKTKTRHAKKSKKKEGRREGRGRTREEGVIAYCVISR
jgi:hypothetical protein